MARYAVHRWVGAAALAAVLAASSALAATPPPKSAVPPGGSPPVVLIPLRAKLDSAHVVPALKVAVPAATGRFNGGLVRVVSLKRGERVTIAWSLFWSLSASSLTGPATAAQIHVGGPGEIGPVLVPLCGPCGSRAGGAVRNLTREQVTVLRSGNLYVNVQTAANPSGEIRGQVTRRPPVRPGDAPQPTGSPRPLKPLP